MAKYFVGIFGRHLVLAVVLFSIWLLWSGYFDKPTLVAFGALSVMFCVYMAQRAGVLDREGVPTRIFPGIFGYMIWLTFEIGKANFLVVREILRPTLKLSPKMIRVPAYQASDVGKVIFGNSITLTPGTVTIDVEDDCILIHALTEGLADVDGIAAMGEKVCALDGAEGRAWAAARAKKTNGGTP